MHLGVSNGSLTRFVISFSLLTAGINFRTNPVHLLGGRLKLLVNQFFLRLCLGGRYGHGGQQFFAFAVGFFALGAGATVKFLAHAAGIGVHLGNAVTALVIDGE